MDNIEKTKLDNHDTANLTLAMKIKKSISDSINTFLEEKVIKPDKFNTIKPNIKCDELYSTLKGSYKSNLQSFFFLKRKKNEQLNSSIVLTKFIISRANHSVYILTNSLPKEIYANNGLIDSIQSFLSKNKKNTVHIFLQGDLEDEGQNIFLDKLQEMKLLKQVCFYGLSGHLLKEPTCRFVISDNNMIKTIKQEGDIINITLSINNKKEPAELISFIKDAIKHRNIIKI